MLLLGGVSAQKTQTFQMPDAQLKTAKELFDTQQYGAAKDLFMKIMSDEAGFCEAQREEALFYAAVCACRL